MNIEIVNKQSRIDIYGFSAVAQNKEYAETALRLSGEMWKTVKSNNLKNKGINIWVCEHGDLVFAGVELEDIPEHDIGLERKIIILTKYAYYKHVGPYQMIKQVGLNMQAELKSKGFETSLQYIEVYGHWTNDETKLETELIMCLK